MEFDLAEAMKRRAIPAVIAITLAALIYWVSRKRIKKIPMWGQATAAALLAYGIMELIVALNSYREGKAAELLLERVWDSARSSALTDQSSGVADENSLTNQAAI